jgi:NADH:ubiquinone oxidoreductase subunit F (NADH-binding)
VELAGFLMFCLTVANAQINTSSLLSTTSEKTTSTNYYYARPNDITIIVNVMGFVQRPGRYEIASSIDLVNLISLAGGPTTDGTLSKVKIFRILGEGAKMTHQEIQLDLDDFSKIKQKDFQLTPGDVVMVDCTAWSTVRDVFGVVIPAVLITSSIMQIIYISNK